MVFRCVFVGFLKWDATARHRRGRAFYAVDVLSVLCLLFPQQGGGEEDQAEEIFASGGAVGLLASPASLWLGPTIQLAGRSLSARFPIFRASEFIVFTATR